MQEESTAGLRANFEKAVERVNQWKEPIPPDTLLRLYAYYKVARSEEVNSQDTIPLIDGFKANALLQVSHLNVFQAMEGYIQVVERELKDRY